MDEPLLCANATDTHSSAFHAQEGDFLLPQLSVKLKDDIILVNNGTQRRTWIVEWSRQRFTDPCRVILRRGLEPKFLSLSMALGVTIGLLPICGVTVVLCAMAAVILQSKCHVPTLMLANFVVSPFQLMIPFMRVGESVTGADHLTVAPGGFWVALRRHEPRALMYGMMLHVIIGWCLFAPLSVAFLYIVSLPIFRYSLTKCGLNQVLHNPS